MIFRRCSRCFSVSKVDVSSVWLEDKDKDSSLISDAVQCLRLQWFPKAQSSNGEMFLLFLYWLLPLGGHWFLGDDSPQPCWYFWKPGSFEGSTRRGRGTMADLGGWYWWLTVDGWYEDGHPMGPRCPHTIRRSQSHENKSEWKIMCIVSSLTFYIFLCTNLNEAWNMKWLDVFSV